MKTKFLLNSFTKKFYINNEEDNVPIVPLIHIQITKEICDSNISQIQNLQKEKVMIKSKSCVSNRITPKKVIDEYFNQRHMNTMKRINTLRDIKFENEMKEVQSKPIISNKSKKLAMQRIKRNNSYYYENKKVNDIAYEESECSTNNIVDSRKKDLMKFILYANGISQKSK